MSRRGEIISIGEAAERVVASVAAKMGAERTFRTDQIAAEGPRLWSLLRSAAHEARRCGVTVSLIPHGFIVRGGAKAEIVRWDQVDVGLLEKAIDRVSPLKEYRDG